MAVNVSSTSAPASLTRCGASRRLFAPRFVRGDKDPQLGRDQEEELHTYFRIPPYWRAI